MNMDRRTFLRLAAGTTGALYLGACSRDNEAAQGNGQRAGELPPAPRPTIRLAGGDQGFPSPFAYRRGPGYVQASYLYDTLLWTDSTGKFIPWLASSYQQSPDGRRYTFELRDNVKWHDGRPFTPDDVAFTFDYFQSQRLSPQVIVQPEIKGGQMQVRVTGPRTVEFNLRDPVVTFIDFVAGAVPIVPEHIWSQVPEARTASDPALLVGTGPYRLESYSPGEGAYLYTAYDQFFLGRPFVKRVENRPVGDPLAALQAGQIDASGRSGLRPEALGPFRADPSFEILKGQVGDSMSALYWNLARGGALADARFRQACAKAIDREDLVKRLFGGNGTPGSPGWIPPTDRFHAPVEQYRFDLAAANRMLDDAGYRRSSPDGPRQAPDGRPLRFGLLLTNQPGPPVVDVLVRALMAVGVEVTPQPVDTPTFNQRVLRGDAEMSIIGSGGLNGYPDYLRRIYSSKTQITQHAQGYANPEVDALCDQQLVTVDEEERKRLVARIQEAVARDLPLLPLYYPDNFHIFKKPVFDQWYFTPGGLAGNIPVAANKHAFVTGVKTGVEIRKSQ